MLTAEASPALTTRADHNGTRHWPTPADACEAQPQVSDGGTERAAQRAALSPWVTRVLVPVYRPIPALAPCWRAHWAAIWELGVLWAEWRRVYGRKAPKLAGALELAGRWAPGVLDRVRRELAQCTDRQCILAMQARQHPHSEPPAAHWAPATQSEPGSCHA